jgi:hypothetical protein
MNDDLALEPISRRRFLEHLGGGLGGIALASLLHEQPLAAGANGSAADGSGGSRPSSAADPANAAPTRRVLHHPAKATRVVQLFMSGAASQCDTFDYKPRLIRDHGKPWDPGEKVELFQSTPGMSMKSPWKWRPYGQSGKFLNDCVAPLGDVADEMAFVHDLVSKSNVHGPATFLQATGFVLPGFPGMGSWVSYGLGKITDNLPTFVVLPDPRGFPPGGPKNWGAGFLPAEHQGTVIRPSARNPIHDLFPPAGSTRPEVETELRRTLATLNREHESHRPGDSRLDARIRSYELAARLQLSAPEALNLAGEPEHILRMYGLDTLDIAIEPEISERQEIRCFGRNCLVARRLLERGVRFVQIWSGADNGFPRRNWDSHEDLARDHWPLGRGMATGAAALIRDLRQRGMLDDTLILWTTEFGRMPCSQGSLGRDHNPFCFTNWLAGGGVKGGVTVGASDDWSYKPADPGKAHSGYDIHATALHLLGIDHTRLSVRHNGIDRRLTDVHGHVIRELLT